MKSKDIIEKLELVSHPEGGYYKEVYRSEESISHSALPPRFKGERKFSTSIYFMLEEEQISHLHRLKSDEIWYYHSGSSFIIHKFDQIRGYTKRILGCKIDEGEDFQIVIPHGAWFASELLDKSTYGLVSCVVSPGFDFNDFELAEAGKLSSTFPEQIELLKKLTLR
ncbi:MAG: cupin domain-containing protein [Bacteroidetes bacterium]|nr:cupin domain-containing protein [Bacteroidota bacterium]